MYSHKDSGFKAQGILNYPIILSISTTITKESNNIDIRAYTFNKTYNFFKSIIGVAGFEELEASISLGDSDIQSMTPLFSAANDQE